MKAVAPYLEPGRIGSLTLRLGGMSGVGLR